MKYLVLALALVSPTAFAQTKLAEEGFEVPAGCMYFGTKGQCVVTNHSKNTVTCEVQTLGATKGGMRIGNTKILVIEPMRYDTTKVFASDSDKFESVKATAFCR